MFMEDLSQSQLAEEISTNGPLCAVIDFKGDAYILKASLTPFVNGKPYQDRDWLVDHYVKNSMTMAELATLCGCTAATINQWLVKHGIETRSRGRR